MSQCRAVRPVPAKDTAKAFYFEVESPDRTYLINADSADSRDSWVQTIQDAIDKMSLKRQDGALTVVRLRGLRAQQLVASGVADAVHTLCVDLALSFRPRPATCGSRAARRATRAGAAAGSFSRMTR